MPKRPWLARLSPLVRDLNRSELSSGFVQGILSIPGIAG